MIKNDQYPSYPFYIYRNYSLTKNMKVFFYMFIANVNKWERIILKKRYTASCKTYPKFEVIIILVAEIILVLQKYVIT